MVTLLLDCYKPSVVLSVEERNADRFRPLDGRSSLKLMYYD
jgi:hypothetical protein